MKETSLVILAAGMGSRYGGLKQIDPVGPHGELLIEYSIYDALSVGIEHIAFVIQESQEQTFRDMLETKIAERCRVSFVHQELTDLPAGVSCPLERKKPWGTGHAVLSCRHVVQGPFAVINADDFYGGRSYAVLAEHLGRADGGTTPTYALVGFALNKTITEHGTVSRGICRVDADGQLLGIDERTKVGMQAGSLVYWDEAGISHKLPESSVASMNMWAFPPSFMTALAEGFADFQSSPGTDRLHDEFFLPAAVDHVASTGKAVVRVLPTSEAWMGVTYRDDLARVREGILTLIESGVYPSDLWAE